MSSIATFYILPESKRDAFAEAQRTDKTVTFKKGFLGFGTQEFVTGERYLWEYLDQEASSRHDFDHSGFAIVDYLLTFVQLPEQLQTQLTSASSPDGHYFRFEHSFASSLADHLDSHPFDHAELTEFSSEQGQDASEYALLLAETRTTLIHWLRLIYSPQFGVLHLTF